MSDKVNNYIQINGLFFSDLACERRRADTTIPGVEWSSSESGNMKTERIKISSEKGAESIGRPCGNYHTIISPEFTSLCDSDISHLTSLLAEELTEMCSPFRTGKTASLLVAGLGNRLLTPDAVGPLSAEECNPTRHIMRGDKKLFDELKCDSIAVVSPGVSAATGLEAADMVAGAAGSTGADIVIAIDALCARSVSRLATTIQISDTGIFPGSGVGNNVKPLNRDTVGVPVIAVGVPTMIDSRVFTLDILDGAGNQKAKDELIDMLDEIPVTYVTPRLCDGVVKSAAKIIGGAINRAFGVVV